MSGGVEKEIGNTDDNSTSSENGVIQRPLPTLTINDMYFINNPVPSENDNVILVRSIDNTIIENWGKITNITYFNTKNIDIIPLLYSEYDTGLSDDDKQLLLNAINEISTNKRPYIHN